MRYDRSISNRFQDILMGPLAFLKELDQESGGRDYFLYDVQLRERDQLMIYCGTSRVVVCQYLPNHHQLKVFGRQRYQNVSKDLMKTWDCQDTKAMKRLADLLKHHLKNVHNHNCVPKSNYGNKKEGYWQNRICTDFGTRWQPSDEWLIVDREVVVGFDCTAEKERVLSPIRAPYETTAQDLCEKDPKRWGTPGKKKFGDELDLLAVDSKGNLVCIELTHGTPASGIYWGMYPAAVYSQIAETAADVLICGTKSLIRQKMRLGLLPESAHERLCLLDKKRRSKKAVLAIAEPNWSSSCWRNLTETVRRHPETEETTILDIGSPKDGASQKQKVQLKTISLDSLSSDFRR